MAWFNPLARGRFHCWPVLALCQPVFISFPVIHIFWYGFLIPFCYVKKMSGQWARHVHLIDWDFFFHFSQKLQADGKCYSSTMLIIHFMDGCDFFFLRRLVWSRFVELDRCGRAGIKIQCGFFLGIIITSLLVLKLHQIRWASFSETTKTCFMPIVFVFSWVNVQISRDRYNKLVCFQIKSIITRPYEFDWFSTVIDHLLCFSLLKLLRCTFRPQPCLCISYLICH